MKRFRLYFAGGHTVVRSETIETAIRYWRQVLPTVWRKRLWIWDEEQDYYHSYDEITKLQRTVSAGRTGSKVRTSVSRSEAMALFRKTFGLTS